MNAAPLDPILIVDDEASVRALFAKVLRAAGYETLEAADGEAALRIIEARPIALLVVDNSMPRLGGAALIRILRAREATRTLPIIVVSARASPEEQVSGLEGGADDFLAKPVEISELVARVRAQFRSHAAWAELAQRELVERRAVTAALRRVRLDPSLELTARSIVEELLAGRDGLSLALLVRTPPGPVVSMASKGPLAEVYRRGVSVRPGEAAELLRRAIEGPWIQRVRRSGAKARTTNDGDRFDAAYLPLETDGGPIGFLIVAPDLGSSPARQARRLVRWLPLMSETADLVASLLRPAFDATATLSEARSAIERVIARREFVPHFQPLVQLIDGAVFGYEGLTRFTDGRPPDVMFAEGERLGLGRALEMATLEATVMAAATLPPGRVLSLNISPALLLAEPTLDMLLSRADRDIVLELTEHAPVPDYDALRARIDRLHASVRIAIDDAGAGFASLRHVVAIRPNFVKLDISLVRGIELDAARQALVAGFVHFASETGCELIGEGIQTEPERQTLVRLGVRQGQGYLFGRPVPAPG